MPVMKFGGSSLADAVRIKKAATIIKDRHIENASPVIVVSAMQGITDLLIKMAHEAETNHESYHSNMEFLCEKHLKTAQALVQNKSLFEELNESLIKLFDEIKQILQGITLLQECSLRTKDMLAGFGERLSSLILSYHLQDAHIPAKAVDSREIIRTDEVHEGANVDFKATSKLIHSRLSKRDYLPIVTGFISSTENGINTTLGRNGSDYTASLLGAGLKTDCVEIWTDVDGIMTADPRIVKNAWVINEISYAEAMELSYFGAEVIHPFTIIPIIEEGIPMVIKNTLKPSAPGTIIKEKVRKRTRDITGIASIEKVSIITIEGGGMIGVPGIANDIFSFMARSMANVIMISQASSEHTICLVCRTEEAQRSVKILKEGLAAAIESKKIRSINLLNGLEIIAVVGENMRGKPGLSGQLFMALGNADVNVFAIAQGSSELNISFVINESQGSKAILAIHKSLIESKE